MKDLLDKLRAAISRIKRKDSQLAPELDERRRASTEAEAVTEGFVPELGVEGGESANAAGMARVAAAEPDPHQRRDFVAETIVLRTGRPVLAIVNDETQLEFHDVDSEIWRERLTGARSQLARAARAVGRIELRGHPFYQWVGTGWLVAPDVIVTNRHVAREFGRRNGDGFIFKMGLGNQRIGASIDFLEEFGRSQSLDFALEKILHIEEDDGPDIAFLCVTPNSNPLAKPIVLATKAPEEDQLVAVIGYPARDSRIPDQALMESIFGNVYDKKRLAPGQVEVGGSSELRHDCSTLGGNSGSVVLALHSGEAVGLHFAGRFLETNFAVPAHRLAERLAQVSGERTARVPRSRGAGSHSNSLRISSAAGLTAANIAIFDLPIRISIELGTPVLIDTQARTSSTAPVVRPTLRPASTRPEDEVIIEGKPADYEGRSGYQPEFLGPSVPLPELTRGQTDLLTFDHHGREESELRYQHFSVKMSRSRRLCIFSAVNINGRESRKSKRPGWRTDGRIPADGQILRECYGDPPKFSRGHMTRREDPVWGNFDEAELGNQDSMHVTNTVPQMQPFNAGIWLALENYALENARDDDMRISVFTGPFLLKTDTIKFGVQIPVTFWKVIAFIHDETRELSATGYTMSQKAFLMEEEHVFGQHETTQTSIASIEKAAGLSFWSLAELDPLAKEEEGVAPPLTDVSQIRFF